MVGKREREREIGVRAREGDEANAANGDREKGGMVFMQDKTRQAATSEGRVQRVAQEIEEQGRYGAGGEQHGPTEGIETADRGHERVEREQRAAQDAEHQRQHEDEQQRPEAGALVHDRHHVVAALRQLVAEVWHVEHLIDLRVELLVRGHDIGTEGTERQFALRRILPLLLVGRAIGTGTLISLLGLLGGVVVDRNSLLARLGGVSRLSFLRLGLEREVAISAALER